MSPYKDNAPEYSSESNVSALLLQDDGGLLFSRKEDYIMTHTEFGRSLAIEHLPSKKRRKIIYDNMHLMDGMMFTANNNFPQMAPYTGSTDFTAVPYSMRNQYRNQENVAIHFFLEDYVFRDAVWCRLEQTTMALVDFDVVFSPDLSLWRNLRTEFPNKENIYRSRFVGAYWQLCGYNVVPTASWGGLESLLFCFEGLPNNSIIAVSGMGNRKSADAFSLWCHGLRCLEKEKSPILILIYGAEVDIPGLQTPVKFIPDYISKHFRNGTC